MGIFGNTFGPLHLIVILAIVLLLFGAPKLPGLARSIGQSMKIFRNEIKDPNKVAQVDAEGTDASAARAEADADADAPTSAAKKPESS